VFLFESGAAEFVQDWEMLAERFQGSQDLLEHCFVGRDGRHQRCSALLPQSDFLLGFRHLKLPKGRMERERGYGCDREVDRRT